MRLLLIAISGTACALESDWKVDFDRADHQKHAIAGAIISGGSRLALEWIAPDAPAWTKDVAAIGVGVLAGVVKELVDRNRDGHSSERGDITATAIGAGLGGAAVSLTLRWEW